MSALVHYSLSMQSILAEVSDAFHLLAFLLLEATALRFVRSKISIPVPEVYNADVDETVDLGGCNGIHRGRSPSRCVR